MREFILRSLSYFDSNKKNETVEVIEWPDFPASASPLRSWNVYSSTWIKCCDCDGQNGNSNKNRKCLHVALMKTWARQGRPQPDVHSARYGDITEVRVYGVDEEGFICYQKNGQWVKLSTVEAVNQGPEEKDPVVTSKPQWVNSAKSNLIQRNARKL